MKEVVSNFITLKQACTLGKGDVLVYINNPAKVSETTTKLKGYDCDGNAMCATGWSPEDREGVWQNINNYQS
jgi:hypothetical protein